MPLQNRITPFGTPIVAPARGAWMGNRGRLHDRTRQIIPGRVEKGTTRAWITCLLSFKARRRTVMSPGRYTELFFLDEATAFAAGHRPCWECRRPDALTFRRAWCAGQGRDEKDIRAADIDQHLQDERSVPIVKRRVLDLNDGVPEGVFVIFPNDIERAYVVSGDGAWRWSVEGYHAKRALEGEAYLLTPPSIMAAFIHGYCPQTFSPPSMV